MQSVTTLLLALSCLCLLLSQHFYTVNAFRLTADGGNGELDEDLTIAVLENLIANLQGSDYKAKRAKRPIGLGYGNRYGVARNVGSKLMALKTAADWNGPGRRRRSTSADDVI